jgi:hypothetical protein
VSWVSSGQNQIVLHLKNHKCVWYLARRLLKYMHKYLSGHTLDLWNYTILNSVINFCLRLFLTQQKSFDQIKPKKFKIAHAKCKLNTHECDFNKNKIGFYTQSKISTPRVWFYTQIVLSTHTRGHVCVYIWHSRVWFLHAMCNIYTQCDFERHECDFNKLECDFNTHKIDFYTQSTISTRRV